MVNSSKSVPSTSAALQDESKERIGPTTCLKEETSHDPQQLPATAVTTAPLVANYDAKIRPLLDVVDKLRHLQVTKQGIEIPTIVVVGDQSSGKSSVLESLAGIRIPRGQGICTRVPLIMRLQNETSSSAKDQQQFQLEFHGKVVHTDETHISKAISSATKEIAGPGKCISNTPLTLVVKKKGVPDLTMVDLPGITRVPVHGQPDDIYEQISSIIMEYIKPKESIILNVLSATVDFPTCESIRMSQTVDEKGERTLAVVTKVDRAPEGLLEKVTTDAVNIGLGYVCVRNRIGDETYQHARLQEAMLFESHPLLSKLDKSIVGIPILAQKLVQIQATSLSRCLPDIVKNITEKLNQNLSDLNKLPRSLSTTADAMTALMRVLGSAKESLRKILVRGEFDEYPDDSCMHCTARLADMLAHYSSELQNKPGEDCSKGHFLVEEIRVLENTKGIMLPNFLPRTAFLTLLQRKVNQVADIPVEFIGKIWDYVEDTVVRVLLLQSESYPQLQSLSRRAAHNLMSKVKCRSISRVKEIVEMEKDADYSCSPEYMEAWSRLIAQQRKLMEARNNTSKPWLQLEMLGEVDVRHLTGQMVEQAFDIKMRLMAYWRIVQRRLVDNLALYLLFSVKNLVNEEIEAEIVNEVMTGPSGGIERLLEDSPSVAAKREKLNRSIKLLKDSKDVVVKIIEQDFCSW